MAKKIKTISYIAIGSALAAAGIYRLSKMRQKSKLDIEKIVDEYNYNHGNSGIIIDSIEPIDPSKRQYHELCKKK